MKLIVETKEISALDPGAIAKGQGTGSFTPNSLTMDWSQTDYYSPTDTYATNYSMIATK